MGNIVKDIFSDVATNCDIHFEFGSPKEIDIRLAQLGKVNKTKFPALLLFNSYEEDVQRFFTKVECKFNVL